MKILFDQGTPAPLRRSLPKHEVVTAFERGSRLAIVVVKTTNWPRIGKHIEIVAAAIDDMQAGGYHEIEI